MEKKCISALFDELKTIGLWSRIFRWSSVRNLSFDAFGEYNGLLAQLENKDQIIANFEVQIRQSNSEREAESTRLTETIKECDLLRQEATKLNSDAAVLQSEKEGLIRQNAESKAAAETKEREFTRMQNELTAKEKRITELEKEKEERSDSYAKNVEILNQSQDAVRLERERLHAADLEKEEKRLQALKDTWSRHEIDVEEKMRSLCQKYSVEYIGKEKVPFKGKPDNAVKICDEYIIFDSKSPQSDDLGNFESYIKSQAESAKKYAKQEQVKNEIFLVVPTNAISVLRERVFNLVDYKVFIITTDALEPVLISLQKIEEYEFTESLSPEDRQAICTVVGKMAHGIKRRIQVDQYFANEFIGILQGAENMPKDFLDEAVKIERAAKINPPQEKRSKEIPLSDLIRDSNKLQLEIKGKGISVSSVPEKLPEIPLYTTNEDKD